jgi:hypothetical protein
MGLGGSFVGGTKMQMMENGRLRVADDRMDRAFDSLEQAEGALAGISILLNGAESELENPSLMEDCFKAVQGLADSIKRVREGIGVAEMDIMLEGRSLIVGGEMLNALRRLCPAGECLENFTVRLLQNAV